MKKLFYALPIIGLLFFISCDKDESDEIIDETIQTDQDQIEIEEVSDNKGLDEIAIPPGLYGPINTRTYTNVRYTYIPTSTATNAIPASKRRFRIYFYVRDLQSGWTLLENFNLQSNTVNIQFPRYLNYPYTDWYVTYEMYHANNANISYKKGKKVTVYNPIISSRSN